MLALDLATPAPGRGQEVWEPPRLAPHVDAPEALALLSRGLGHEVEVARVTYATLDERLDALARSCDVALNLCDGIGRDGFPGVEVVEALAARGVPCAGAGRDFLLVGVDKALARARLRRRGLRVAPGVVVDDDLDGGALRRLAALRPPLVIKPREGGGSVGVEVVVEPADVRARVEAARARYGGLVVEELVAGPELSVAVLGRGERLRVLPAVEVVFADGTPLEARALLFDDKHDPATLEAGRWWLECPATRPAAERALVEAAARAAYEALDGDGHGRVDLRLTPEGPVILEVNPNPSLEPVLRRDEQGLYARALTAGGVSLLEWVRTLIEDALERGA